MTSQGHQLRATEWLGLVKHWSLRPPDTTLLTGTKDGVATCGGPQVIRSSYFSKHMGADPLPLFRGAMSHAAAQCDQMAAIIAAHSRGLPVSVGARVMSPEHAHSQPSCAVTNCCHPCRWFLQPGLPPSSWVMVSSSIVLSLLLLHWHHCQCVFSYMPCMLSGFIVSLYAL